MKRIVFACLPLLISLGALGCDRDLPGKPKPEDSPVAADKVTNFDTLYSKNCAGCHGKNGTTGPAPPLNDPHFLTMVSDEELVKVIAGGRMVHAAQKTSMPAFASDKGGPLTSKQVEILAKGIKEKWKERSPVVIKTEAGKAKGEDVFKVACAGCHGPNGEGGKSAGALREPAFLGLISDQALRRIVITGRPDLGMPAFDDKKGRPPEFEPLTSAQIDAVVELLVSWRNTGTVTSGK